MPEFNQGAFHHARKLQSELEKDYKELGKYFDKDGFFDPSYDLINDFGREADRLFREANDCEEAHNNILRNAKISKEKLNEYEIMRDRASEIAGMVKNKFDQNINDNTLIGNDSDIDRYLLDGFEINK